MKYLIFCMLTLSILNTKAQKKISFTVFAGSNFTSSEKTEHSFNTIEHYQIGTWVGDTLTLGKNYFNYTLQSSYSGKYGFSFGAKADYTITDNFSVSGGIGISKIGIKRKNQLSYKLTRKEQIKIIHPQPPPGTFYFIPGLETTGYEKTATYYYYVYEENISMVSLHKQEK
ncbi:MAG: hypothetical protein IPL50_20390 [Chitinophagaceae bacterium]|nr:hypothetical protein [Chitinophagaceae bacterium]